jgi:F-type H+-transporting ATPase subunit delta
MPSIHTDAVAQVYARSVYELAEQAGGRDKIMEIAGELEQIAELTREDRSLAAFLASPVIDRKRRADAVRRIFRERVTDLTLRFLLVLNANDRLGHLPAICEAYDQLVHARFGRIEVDAFTAVHLAEAQKETIRKRVGAALGKEVVLYAYTDPQMIGGLKLRIGDRLIDGSVSGILRRMRGRLRRTGGAAAAGRESIARFIEEGEEP